ncbi:hypothetical protein A3Q56_00624 [Intoshia linei]|uniref:Uncharacterized protein n=1 Tax=Intoshia linei TaxID=1819745 RepID=A0A177BBS2_9BILA|nr:hypothetical protein A3Q56_00624 [Intoshia linei]
MRILQVVAVSNKEDETLNNFENISPALDPALAQCFDSDVEDDNFDGFTNKSDDV